MRREGADLRTQEATRGSDYAPRRREGRQGRRGAGRGGSGCAPALHAALDSSFFPFS